MDNFTKKVAEIEEIQMDFSPSLITGETILTESTVAILGDQEIINIVLDSAIDTPKTSVFVKLQDGVNGNNYIIRTTVNTSISNTYILEVLMTIYEEVPIEEVTAGSSIPVLTVGTDTYISLDDANTLMYRRLNTSSWQSASQKDRACALLEACERIDNLIYLGSKFSETQTLQFPRYYKIDRNGIYNSFRTSTEIVPEEVKKAQCLEAMFLLTGIPNEIQAQRRGIRKIKVNNLEETYSDYYQNIGLYSEDAYSLIEPWIQKTFHII
jgi:hypothetical protein